MVYKQSEDKNVLLDQRTHKKILNGVVIAHVVIISTILLWGVVAELFSSRPEKIINVSLYTPPSDTKQASYTPPKKSKSKKKVSKKPKKRPVKKKKWKAVKRVKVSKDLVYVKPKKTVSSQVKTMDRNKLVAFLKQNKVKISSKSGNPGISQSYENSVGAYLYQVWDTPDKSVLGRTRPEVKIQLNIAATGQLLSGKILRKSGVAAMDKSVERLLQKIKFLPVPKGGAKKIILILEVVE